MGFHLEWTITKKAWLDNPPIRWNAGLVEAGTEFRNSMQEYPPESDSPFPSTRSGALGNTANFDIVEEGRLMHLMSLVYGKYLLYGTGIYGPTGQPIVSTEGGPLSWEVPGFTGLGIQTIAGVERRFSKSRGVSYMGRDTSKNINRVFFMSIKGTIWAGKMEELKERVKEGFKNGVVNYQEE